jgi:hypothetical protein
MSGVLASLIQVVQAGVQAPAIASLTLTSLILSGPNPTLTIGNNPTVTIGSGGTVTISSPTTISSVAIQGGTINNTVIGNVTSAAATFTMLTAKTSVLLGSGVGSNTITANTDVQIIGTNLGGYGGRQTTSMLSFLSSDLTANTIFTYFGAPELLLTTSSNGNTLAIENTSASGYVAVAFRGIDSVYASRQGFPTYEHGAVGWDNPGQYCYVENSRFDGTFSFTLPAPEYHIQQTGGQSTSAATTQTVGITNISTTITSGTNLPANNSIITGTGIPVGAYLVSGGGTTSGVLSVAATTTNASLVATIYATPTYNRRDIMVFDGGYVPQFVRIKNLAAADFVRFDRLNSSVGISTSPVATVKLDVLGTGAFGTATTNRNSQGAFAPLLVADAGAGMIRLVRDGVQSATVYFNGTYNASRLDFTDEDHSITPLSMSTSGNGAVTLLTARITSTSGPTMASGTGAPSGSTFNGVTGATAGTPATGSLYIRTDGAVASRTYWYFGGAWAATATP